MRVRLNVGATHRKPHVAVVIPCYNYGRFLGQCVNSVLTQSGVTVEAHIVDDASTDDTMAVAEQLASTDPRVRVLHHERNLGHIRTYNDGLQGVDSDNVILLSADDMLAPGALDRATALMQAQPRVGMTYGHPQTFETEPRIREPGLVSWSTWDGQEWIRRQFNRGLSCIYSPEALVRTSVQHEVGYYDPALPATGDIDMWLRIASVARIGRVNGADQAYRRLHPASMMQTQFAGVVVDTTERMRAYEHHLATRAEGGTSQLREVMNRRAIQEVLGWARTGARAGTLDRADLEAAMRFAAEIDPEVAHSHEWADLQTWVHGGSRSQLLRAQTRDYLRSRRNAVRWRRWRYLGV